MSAGELRPAMSALEFLLPWQPSPLTVLATVLAAWLYFRGCRRATVGAWRRTSFWLGLILMYVALHTRVDYYAEREFFIHRLQHMVLHHLAPFFIALAWPMPALTAGTPERWREAGARIARWRVVRIPYLVVTNPIVTGAIFVGLIWLWLIPSIHFYAMLDVRLYKLMNWSMALDGLVFWCLVLDPRASPPARLPPGARVILQVLVIPPQVASGAIVTFASSNLYPLYELCGRAFANIGAHEDQTIGGLILWIPSTMMTLAGALIAMYTWFQLAENAQAPAPWKK